MKNFLAITMIALASLVFSVKSFAEASLTDSQIEGLVKTANNAEIKAAQLAQSRAKNDEVKKFADMMVNDHKENNKEGKDLAKKIEVKPEVSADCKTMEKQASQKISDLKKVKSAEFDLAYMDLQVDMHTQVLNDLDQKLIPASQSPELKSFLQATRVHVAHHLAQAEALQKSLRQ